MLRTRYTRSAFDAFALFIAICLVSGCQTDSAESQDTGPPPLPEDQLAIENPWVHPAPAGSSSALYMTIANGLQNPDTLLEASAPIIDSSEVHQLSAGDTSPQKVGMLEIPSRTRVTLAPGSTFVRLVNLDQSLDENGTVVLNVDFAQSGLQRVRVPVQSSPPTSSQQ